MKTIACGSVYSTALFVFGTGVSALPPLGLTEISPAPTIDMLYPRTYIDVFGEVAYVSSSAGVWNIDGQGQVELVQLVHPDHGVSTNATRVVDGPNGQFYVGANFGDYPSNGSAIFKLESPGQPIVSFPAETVLIGLDYSLRGYGFVPSFTSSWFNLDGSTTFVPAAPGDPVGGQFSYVSRLGYAFGSAPVPGTIGTEPALWNPAGGFQFVQGAFGVETSIRDRADGTGPNLGWAEAGIKYGDRNSFWIKDENGTYPGELGGLLTIVSQGDFVVISNGSRLSDLEPLGYFPGIIPANPNAALLLNVIFPELMSLDIDSVYDITAIDRHLFMVLEADGKLYLFGARDPSVVPEPSTLSLLAVAFLLSLVVRCRRSR